jgi:TPR repeat protein
MPISSPKRAILFGVVMGVAVAVSGLAHAFDAKSIEKEKKSPWAVFRLGFSAYKKGDKEEAVEAYRYAADKGQVGASWKLAKMYASGDGVTQNDYEAYKFFSQIVEEDVRPGSPDESYVSDALVALGNYSRIGIPGSPVEANLAVAQDFYMRAAATYRNPAAQFELGKMFLNGDGVKASIRQAGRWLQLAAEKGHAGAQATLGNLLFQSGKIVRGLAMMTEALSHAPATDLPWIRQMQEEAFALAGEGDRRTAIALADSMREGGGDPK